MGFGLVAPVGIEEGAGAVGFRPRVYLPDPRAGPGLNWQVV